MDIYIHDQQDDESISQANKWIQPTKVGICPRNSEFPISYMGCHPKPIDELHHFSRCFFNHQPVIETNHPTIIQPTTSHRSTEKRGRPGGLNIGDGTHVRQLIAPTTKSWRSPKEKCRTLTGKNRGTFPCQGRFG